MNFDRAPNSPCAASFLRRPAARWAVGGDRKLLNDPLIGSSSRGVADGDHCMPFEEAEGFDKALLSRARN